MNHLYFAYGSNMSTVRLRARIPRAEPIGAARIEGFETLCNKRGKDGSGKANLVPTPAAEAWGVLFRLDAADWEILDRYEWGYRRSASRVLARKGKAHRAQLYLALQPEEHEIPPFDWYRALCLEGAREHALPESTIARITGWTVELSDR